MLLQIMQDAANSTDLISFQRHLVDYANELDFGLASAALVHEGNDGKVEIVAVGNTPAGFECLSKDPKDVKRDPVIGMFKKLHLPFCYDQNTYLKAGAIDLWEKQAPFGYKNGIALAIHLPLGRHYLLGIDRSKLLPKNPNRLAEQFGLIRLLAAYTQRTAIDLLTPTTGPFKMPELSRREIEVLQLTALGKSAWAAAKLLSIGECTINFHMRRIHAKLNTGTKQQAVLKASHLDLL
jgi:DNA-binding CsgD family transcriptional regulator